MWKDHYQSLFNSVDHSMYVFDKRVESVQYITHDEIQMVFNKLCLDKSSGMDGLTNENLKYGGPRLVVILRTVFNAMLIHGYLPRFLTNMKLMANFPCFLPPDCTKLTNCGPFLGATLFAEMRLRSIICAFSLRTSLCLQVYLL